MLLQTLRRQVLDANLELVRRSLVLYTFGNASGCAREQGLIAQARRSIPCFETTHADYFHGPVPVTSDLTPQEIAADYEKNTGLTITRPPLRQHKKQSAFLTKYLSLRPRSSESTMNCIRFIANCILPSGSLEGRAGRCAARVNSHGRGS
jgi:hypothetical protein